MKDISNLRKVFSSLSQYFVEVPLAAITASSCLGLYHDKLFLDRLQLIVQLGQPFRERLAQTYPTAESTKGWIYFDHCSRRPVQDCAQ